MMAQLSDFVEINPRTPLPKGKQLPFIGMDVIQPGRRIAISEKRRESGGSGSKFLPKDTLFARITPCLENGKIAQYAGDEPGHGSTEFFILRAKPGISDPDYVYYFALTEKLRSSAEKSMSGASGRQRADVTALTEFKCNFPTLPVQRRIASILSAYDDLIENNLRRIKILEEMARALYREWFVEFRFPGHEKVPLVASATGPIPKGWKIQSLSDLTIMISRGISPSYSEDGESMVINQKCIRDQRLSLEYARRQDKPIPSDKQVRFGDVLINSTGVGTLGRVAQVYAELERCTIDTHITIARPKSEIDVDFFGCGMLAQQNTFERLGVGATGQTELGRTAIAQVDFLDPPTQLRDQFGRLVRPMRLAVSSLLARNENLRKTRDLLLPRLLSGHQVLAEAESYERLKGQKG